MLLFGVWDVASMANPCNYIVITSKKTYTRAMLLAVAFIYYDEKRQVLLIVKTPSVNT